MLGTFSFELYFKSYCLFTFRSLEISEFAKQSIFFHLSTTPLLPAASAVRRPPAALGRPRPRSASRWLPRVALMLPTALLGLRWSLPASPRRPEPPRGRHRNAAVERPLQSPPPSPSACTSTIKAPASDSSHPFALSSLPRHRTPPPLHPERRPA